MEHDDRQIGRILSRREALSLFGLAGMTMLAACAQPGFAPSAGGPTPTDATEPAAEATTVQPTPEQAPKPTPGPGTGETVSEFSDFACVVRPESAAGPFYVDVGLLRSDIREDREGLPLTLTFHAARMDQNACEPLPDALVEVWHCDLDGVYSGVRDGSRDARGQTFLRGAQRTDENGQATFTTIYPGWYPVRCVHVHFRIRPTAETVFTSQLYFPDPVNAEVFRREPYARRGQPAVLNGQDSIFRPELMIDVTSTQQGYAAVFPIGVDLSG